eukprot:TRINITY_DN41399_c0_g1_i1.p3 TRINITY_DN41399_c0_g1~~TRINITY_DN41399_c0_g1_i1.p3  ORF type:complete len:100 (+),score=29.76 TRINITY_DN41399_c0_g1_i1:70-369(+)
MADSAAASSEPVDKYADFAAVRAVMQDKLHQQYYNTANKDLPPRMQPRKLPKLEDFGPKVDWDDWKKWEWMQPGYKGPKQHCVCVIHPDQSAEIRSVWK